MSDRRHTRFMPAYAGIEDVCSACLDIFCEGGDVRPGIAPLDKIENGYPVSDNEVRSATLADTPDDLNR